ncbi:MAG: hypothetical protein M1130_04035 [Actinobacteria bacterium]|nr:hypothetical protein [Actinomycetota bacterium]
MPKIITVLGMVPGAGTTLIASNVSAWLAVRGVKILLLDLSSRGVLGQLFMNEAAREAVFPTTATWRDYNSESLLTTGYGLAVLPGPARDAGRPEMAAPGEIKEMLDRYSNFDALIIDAGGDMFLPCVETAMDVSDGTLLVAEPSQRCLQTVSDSQKHGLIKNPGLQLVVNRASHRCSYYHPRDVARWLGLEEYFEIPDDPVRVIDAARKRMPLVVYGRGKASTSLRNIAGKLFRDVLTADSSLENNPANTIPDSAVSGAKEFNVRRKRTGKPAAVLGIGDSRIEEWIRDNFSDQMDILWCSAEPGELKEKITELDPDICILMRHSAIGGITGADKLAVWAACFVPAVLFIVGELDSPGKAMVDQAGEAGVRHIISCEKGGYISGDELVFVLTGIIREMHGAGEPGRGKESTPSPNGEGGKVINSLLQGAGNLSKALKQSAGTASEKAKVRKETRKVKPGINMSEGISLEEEAFPESDTAKPDNSTSIVPGGILVLVTPWRPNLAGRLAAQAVKLLCDVERSQVAFIGASKDSTGAMWLNIPDDELMMSDWRVPGSRCPIIRDNLSIYAVDPAKDLTLEGEQDLWGILREARKTSTYTVMDFAGDISRAQKAAHQGRAVVLVVLPGGDPVEYKISALWLRNLAEGKQNVVTGIDLRGVPQNIPEGIKPKVVIRNSPADALSVALRKNGGGQFTWN